MRTSFGVCLGLVVTTAFTVIPAQAAPITLYNSGVTAPNNANGTNTSIQTTGGSVDPNYTVQTPGGTTFAPAKVVTDQGAYERPGNSQYINDVGSASGNEAAGQYDYKTTFDLTGLDPTTATISGTTLEDDNLVDVLVNGVTTGITGGGFHLVDQKNFTIPAGFSGFTTGINTLDFIVNNGGPNPTAFLVTNLSGTANSTPEPASLGLLALGAARLSLRRRRRAV